MALTLFIIAILVIFAAYAVAPVFGLDELYPQFFQDDALAWQAAIVGLVLVGAVYWYASRQKGTQEDE